MCSPEASRTVWNRKCRDYTDAAATAIDAAHHPVLYMPASLTPICLLIVSNIFMTFAWYGHLKYKTAPLIAVIGISWGIALIEYCFAVPANRIGHGIYSAAELKGMQEIITLCVFGLFSVLYLGESIRWNHVAAFVLIVAAAFLLFKK